MNFSQWKGHAAKGSVAKVTYCCGEEATLVEIVIEDIRTLLQVPATDYVEMDAGDAFWEAASTYPLDGKSNRLVVVRNAHTISDWTSLPYWLAQTRYSPNNYILFVSNSPDAPSVFENGKRIGYQEHIGLIRTKGKFIKCSTPNSDDLIAWCITFGLTKASAEHLIERTSANVELMYNVLRKVHVWPGSPSNNALDLLVQQQASDSFVDSLVLRDKADALLALGNLTDDDKARVVARLDSRLDMLFEIGKLVRKRVWAGEIAAQTKINVFLVKKFSDVSKDYDFSRVQYCRRILALLDEPLKNTNATGAWETLVTLW
jgi:hypothetical protein